MSTQEQEESLVKLPVELSNAEYKKLLAYADKKLPFDELERLKVEWAINSILTDCIVYMKQLTPKEQRTFLIRLVDEKEARND